MKTLWNCLGKFTGRIMQQAEMVRLWKILKIRIIDLSLIGSKVVFCFSLTISSSYLFPNIIWLINYL